MHNINRQKIPPRQHLVKSQINQNILTCNVRTAVIVDFKTLMPQSDCHIKYVRNIPLWGNLIDVRYIPLCSDLIGVSNTPLYTLTQSFFFWKKITQKYSARIFRKCLWINC